MKGFVGALCSLVAFSVPATGTLAQSTLSPGWARAQELNRLNAARTADLNRPTQSAVSTATLASDPFAGGGATTLDGQARFSAADRAFGSAIEFEPTTSPSATTRSGGLAATSLTDVWFDSGTHSDRLRLAQRGALRRADGSPLPVTLRDRSEFEAEAYDVSYTRGWPVARGYTASGLEVTLTPHAGVSVGADGSSAEAGATLKIGDNLDRLAPDGHERFGDRARWYLYAAGSGRAVGYNFARTRDGDYARSGVSQDKGSFLGDASVGVAYRRGAMQGSFGVVYREITAEGLHGGEGIDRDVAEGLVAFQLSIRPQW
ncbi:hypothetical protein BH10PSE1_BH10PSE1_12780 [soil metagenome]